MVWKIQRGGPWGGNGGGSGQGHWGGGSGPKGGSQPPDIEEILRRSQDKFKKFLVKTGFGHVRIMSLTGGIAFIHSAWRL